MLDHVSVPYCPCCAGLEDHERDCPLRSPGATTWGWTALHLAGEPRETRRRPGPVSEAQSLV